MVYLTKLLFMIAVFAILNLLREVFVLAKDIKLNINYEISNYRLWGIGLSMAYLITILITGIK